MDGHPLTTTTYARRLVSAEVLCTRLFVQSLFPDVQLLRPLRRAVAAASSRRSLPNDYDLAAEKMAQKMIRYFLYKQDKAGEITYLITNRFTPNLNFNSFFFTKFLHIKSRENKTSKCGIGK